MLGDLGYGENKTFYGAAHRSSWYSSNPNPSLVCQNNNDKFTVDSKNGNGKLKYPVGLITLDEVVFAGLNTRLSNETDSSDMTNYLNSNNIFWTFSPIGPYVSDLSRVYVGYIQGNAVIADSKVSSSIGVRPVVSLASRTIVTGEGTSANPYVVK